MPWERVSWLAVVGDNLAPMAHTFQLIEQYCIVLEGRYRMCTGGHPFIPVENVASLEVICTWAGQRVENALHVQYASQPSESDLRNLVDTAIGAWASAIAPLVSEDVILSLVRAKDLTVEDSYGYETAPDVLTTGGAENPSLPNNVTVATKFASGRTGRSYRGRAYWIGLCESQVTLSQLASGMAEAISDAWEAFFLEVENAPGNPVHVVVSYCNSGNWRTNGQATVVTNYSTEQYTDSMRRRLVGRGQ